MKWRVLFLCTGNSSEKSDGQGWLRHLAGDCFEVASAGTRPVGLNPDAVAVMRELGIDVSQHRSKLVDEFLSDQFDYVIRSATTLRSRARCFQGMVPACIETSRIPRQRRAQQRSAGLFFATSETRLVGH
jgi:arsenate reductase